MPAKTRSYIVSNQVKYVPASAELDLFKLEETPYYLFADHKDDLDKSQLMYCKFESTTAYSVADIEFSCMLEDLAAYSKDNPSSALGNIITLYKTVPSGASFVTRPIAYLKLIEKQVGTTGEKERCLEYMHGYKEVAGGGILPRTDQINLPDTEIKHLAINLNKDRILIKIDEVEIGPIEFTDALFNQETSYLDVTIGCLYTYKYTADVPTITTSEQLNNCKIKKLWVKLSDEPVHRFIPCKAICYDSPAKTSEYKRFLSMYCTDAKNTLTEFPVGVLTTCKATEAVSLFSILDTIITGDVYRTLYAPFKNYANTVNPQSLAMKEVEYA